MPVVLQSFKDFTWLSKADVSIFDKPSFEMAMPMHVKGTRQFGWKDVFFL